MALSTEQLLDEFAQMSVLQLSEFKKAFEDKFGAEISDEDAQKITTVGEAVKYIEANKK